MPNHVHAIAHDYQQTKTEVQTLFLMLTRQLMQWQTHRNVQMLHLAAAGTDALRCVFGTASHPTTIEEMEHVEMDVVQNTLANLYQTYDFYKEIKKCLRRTSRLKKVMDSLAEHLPFDGDDANEAFCLFVNHCALINLIRKQMMGKHTQTISEYRLFAQLDGLHPRLASMLYLEPLRTLRATEKEKEEEEVDAFMRSEYSYAGCVSIPVLIGQLPEALIPCIVDLFRLFI